MRKIFNILIISICFLAINIIKVDAYNVNSNNNPGSVYNGSGNGGSSTTYWPVNDEGFALRAVRIRIFRGSTQIKSAYYSLVEDRNKCFSSVNNVSLCETSSYDYSTVNSSTGATCTFVENVSLGCIEADNLLETWSVRSAKGEYLDNYLKSGANPYDNLKNILKGMGYNDTNFNNNDVVIVEPATLVRYDGNDYFGTSTAMMKKNVSYSNMFINLFKSMSTALKVSTAEEYSGDDNYTGYGYFKYDVSGMGYVDPNGDLRVEIYIDGTNPKQLITSESLIFNIRKDHGCTGAIEKKDLSTGNSGYKTENLLTGNYSIEITSKPLSTNYKEKSGINYSCRNVTLTSAGAIVSIPFEKGCNIEKNEKSSDGYTMSDAIELYDKYKFNGLLNTINPVCEKTYCNNRQADVRCLSANLESNISSTDFSCADIYSNANGNSVVFCGDMFSLVNSLELNGSKVETFYGTSGEFLIKKDPETNLYRIYNSGNIPTYISASNGIASATSTRVCYALRDYSLPQNYDKTSKTIKAYLDDKELDSDESILDSTNIISGIFDVHTSKKQYVFDLNEVYLKKISGKINPTSSQDTISIIGLISKFKDKNGSIPFGVVFGSTELNASDENTCKYILTPKIIDFSNDENGRISLEFRTVDTTQPFTRPTNSNWSDGSDNSADNSTVEEFIKNRPNSYGMLNGVKKEPIYRIELTPNDIKLIRKYNKSNSYDNYLTIAVNYSGNSMIRNAFLYNLEQGKINGEDLSNKLYNYKY